MATTIKLLIPQEVANRIETVRKLANLKDITEVITCALAVYDTLINKCHNHEIVIKLTDGNEHTLHLTPQSQINHGNKNH